jgi:hypothetical protein
MMTAAEKQRRYREHALKNPDGLNLTRLQVLLTPEAALNLERLSKHTHWSKRDIIEKALNDLAERLDCNHDKY